MSEPTYEEISAELARVRAALRGARERGEFQIAWVHTQRVNRLVRKLEELSDDEDPILGKIRTIQWEIDHIAEVAKDDPVEAERLLVIWCIGWQRGLSKLFEPTKRSVG